MKTMLDTIYNTYHTMSHSGQESAIDNVSLAFKPCGTFKASNMTFWAENDGGATTDYMQVAAECP